MKFRKAALLFAGWAFIALGIIGLFLPFLQGVLFLLIGLFILSSEYAWARRLLDKVRCWFPKTTEHFDHAAARANAWLRRHFHHREKNKNETAD